MKYMGFSHIVEKGREYGMFDISLQFLLKSDKYFMNELVRYLPLEYDLGECLYKRETFGAFITLTFEIHRKIKNNQYLLF